jgi:hypothetical protein
VLFKSERIFIYWSYFDSNIWCSDTSLFEEINNYLYVFFKSINIYLIKKKEA